MRVDRWRGIGSVGQGEEKHQDEDVQQSIIGVKLHRWSAAAGRGTEPSSGLRCCSRDQNQYHANPYRIAGSKPTAREGIYINYDYSSFL